MNKKTIHIRVVKQSLVLDYFFRGKRFREHQKLKNTSENLSIVQERADNLKKALETLDARMKEAGLVKQSLNLSILKQAITDERIKTVFGYKLSRGVEDFLIENFKKGSNERHYRDSVNMFIKVCGDLDVRNISVVDYQKFKEWVLKERSYGTALTRINYLHILFDWLIRKNKYSGDNVFVKLKERKKQRIVTISDEHWQLILPELKKQNLELYNYIYFLKCSGFRKEEALKQKWGDVHFDKDVLIVTTFKDNSNEDIFPMNLLDSELKKHLFEMHKNKVDENLFHLNDMDILKRFQKVLTSLKLQKYTLHDIRRTFGSYWAVRVSQIQLMKLMRHKSIETTLKYYICIDITSIAGQSAVVNSQSQ
ncbi:MAG: tyrosine-type recombinase/integrase [Ignavibacteriaceae bacterium]|nr:tyrosine-type recombinase/integrase [Ignavibacteriaceae bacterium]